MRTLVSVVLLLFALSLLVACGQKEEAEPTSEQETTQMEEETLAANTAIDPVCEMKVEKEGAQWKADHEGQTYYFCMEEHKIAFMENPDAYLTEE